MPPPWSTVLSAAAVSRPAHPALPHDTRPPRRPPAPPAPRGLFGPSKPLILTEYEDLPPSYRDAEGLPFADRDLADHEVGEIFGRATVRPDAANRLLRILHGRRVAGTLDDPDLAINTSEYGGAAVEAALAHLRRRIPVNEIMNAGLRAQDELDEMDREHQRGEAAAGRAEVVPEKDPTYGYNTLDTVRARNRARAEAEDRRVRAEREARGLSPVALGPLELLNQPRPMSPSMQRWTELATTDTEEPPAMSHWDRLGPSFAFFLIALGGLAALAMFYEPPSDHYRVFPSVSPARATIGALIAANVLVWAAWRIPPLWPVMNRYFVLVHGLPRPVSVLAATCSHITLGHLFVNMAVLNYFGARVHDDVGGRIGFLALYFGAGMAGFLGSMTWFTARGVLTATTIGASGATYGTIGAYFWLHRLDYFKIAGIPPEPMEGVPGLAFLALALGLNFGTVSRMVTKRLDKLSHVVGLLAGVACMELAQWRLQWQALHTAGAQEEAAAAEEKGGGEEADDPDRVVVWNVIDFWTGQVYQKREARKAVASTAVPEGGGIRPPPVPLPPSPGKEKAPPPPRADGSA